MGYARVLEVAQAVRLGQELHAYCPALGRPGLPNRTRHLQIIIIPKTSAFRSHFSSLFILQRSLSIEYVGAEGAYRGGRGDELVRVHRHRIEVHGLLTI